MSTLVETLSYGASPARPCEGAESLADRLEAEIRAHRDTAESLAILTRAAEAVVAVTDMVTSPETQEARLARLGAALAGLHVALAAAKAPGGSRKVFGV